MRAYESLERRELLSAEALGPLLPLVSLENPYDCVGPQSPTTGSTESAPRVAALADATAAVETVRPGLWSAPTTWAGGRVPTVSDDVVIRHDVTIDYGLVRQLTIAAGVTTLAGDLHAYGSVIVESKLHGTHGGIYFHVANDRLFTGNTTPGPDPMMPDFHPEDTGLWVMPDGVIDLEGDYVTPWLDLRPQGAWKPLRDNVVAAPAFVNGTAYLDHTPLGWQPGDDLLLVNERGESRLAKLVSVENGHARYTEVKPTPTTSDFEGNVLVAGTDWHAQVKPKIANLSRRLKIVSADVTEGDTNHRAHTLFMEHADVSLANVEFRNLGPRAKLGRYPVHFHHGGDGGTLEVSSIWQNVTEPGNRFVALHGVEGVKVSANVAFRSRGHGFFMEDGHEINNVIEANLSVDVTSGEELKGLASPIGSESEHFWLRVGNTIRGNVAAGGTAVGLIVLESAKKDVPAVIADMQTLGTGQYGMWSSVDNVTFERPISVYSTRSGYATGVPFKPNVQGMQFIDPIFMMNGEDHFYGSQIFLNYSRNNVVAGGVFAGKTAFHGHYESALWVKSSEIYVDAVVAPSHWESVVRIDNALIRAERLFDSPGYIGHEAPPLVRIKNSNAKLGNDPVQPNLTADYTSSRAGAFFPSLGQTGKDWAVRLGTPAPATGYILPPLDPAYAGWPQPMQWKVNRIGETSDRPTTITGSETRWRENAFVDGYGYGFPPGTYHIDLYDPAGRWLRSGYAIVRSGTVSKVTFKSDALPGDVNFDGRVNQADAMLVARHVGDDSSLADANGDRRVDIFDLNFVIDHLDRTPIAGDINRDGRVDIFDYNFLANNWGSTEPASDVNDDGIVDIFDLNWLVDRWPET